MMEEDQVVDITICHQLNELITQATESGQAKVEENVAKEIKKLCRLVITKCECCFNIDFANLSVMQ